MTPFILRLMLLFGIATTPSYEFQDTGTVNDRPIRFSMYDTDKGGINCGINGCAERIVRYQNEISDICYIAAPPEIPSGSTLTIKGVPYIVVDRGPFIQTIKEGEYDPALDSVAEFEYLWVDILNKDGCLAEEFSYGWLTWDWAWSW